MAAPPVPLPAFELSIGGIRFEARLAPEIRLEEDDRNYLEFVGPELHPLPGEVRIPVTIELGGAPDVELLPQVFDAGTWTAHRDGDATILRLLTPQGPDPYLWTTRIEARDGASRDGGERIRIHCGSLLVGRRGDEVRLRSPLHYPLDQLLAMHLLASRRGLVCHAAGLVADGGGLVFAGRSGAGKTTFTRLTSDRPEIEGLSDDRVIVRRVDDSLLVYGTPWAGEGQVAANRAVPMKALVFLHQASKNELRRITAREALEQLLPVVSVLWFDTERMATATAFCGELVETVPSYELHFQPRAEAIDLLRDL